MNSQKYAGVVWPLLCAVVMGIYGYWALQRELVSSRPSAVGEFDVPDPVPTPGVYTFHSRMWEDPLSESYADWKRGERDGDRASVSMPVQDSKELNECVSDAVAARLTELQAQSELSEAALSSRAKCKMAAWEPLCRFVGFRTRDSQYDAQVSAMQDFFKDLVENEDTTCVPVFLPGGPYAEDKEKRMRIRYAVVTALAESGYHLTYNRRMSYTAPKVSIRVLRGWQQRQVIVPVKLYRHESSNAPQVLVLWINESELGLRPLLATHRILNSLFGRVEKLRKEDEEPKDFKLRIIGPASSDTLDLMAKEIDHLKQVKHAYDTPNSQAEAVREQSHQAKQPWQHWFISSYEPMRSTQGFQPLLNSLWFDKNTTDVLSPRATKAGVEFAENDFVKLHSVIGNDQQLALALRQELRLRGASSSQIVLITEHDTAYGRAVEETFEKVFEKDLPTFKILRGIDGKLPGDDGDNASSGRQSAGPKSSADTREIVERPPAGRTQYDYLRRLRERIEQLGDVKAIGVVGSDVYDKLLVLRALKPHFPDCIFFTTDMDAIYSHSSEIRHAQNLLVASHYGLQLRPELQKSTPPFRDSYQTATFLATRLAIHHDDPKYRRPIPETDPDYETKSAWPDVITHFRGADRDRSDIAAVLSVVGREDVHRLTPDASETSLVHPKLAHRTSDWHYLFLVGFTVVVACGVWVSIHRDRIRVSPLLSLGNADQNRSWIQRSIGALQNRVSGCLAVMLGVGLVLLATFAFRGYEGPEAAYFFGGYSTWPRRILLAGTGIAAVLAFAYFLDEFCLRLRESFGQRPTNGEFDLRSFIDTFAIKIGLLALVIVYVSWLIVCEIQLDSLNFWGPALVTILGLVVWYALKRNRTNVPVSDSSQTVLRREDWILGDDVRPAIGGTLVVVVVVTAFGVLGHSISHHDAGVEETHVGWHLSSASRGYFSRVGDWVATLYAFGGVGLLLAALLYSHVWCREFTCNDEDWERARNRLAFDEDNREDGEHELNELAFDDEDREGRSVMLREHGSRSTPEPVAETTDEHVGRSVMMTRVADAQVIRLQTIGKLTEVPGSLVPVLMASFFTLIVAYHPWLSPTPMPMSLLVLTSLSLVVFILSALSLRWYCHRERKRAIDALDDESFRPNDTVKETGRALGRSERRRRLREGVAELVDVVEGFPQQATAAATLVRTITELEEPESGGRDEQQAKTQLEAQRKRIAALSDGGFRSWNDSALGWIFGSGMTLALADLWVRWWTIGL